MKISDLHIGQTTKGRLVLAGAEVRKTKGSRPSNFLSATFTDGNDTIDAKFWNYNANLGVPESNKVYIISVTVGEYLGKMQLTLTNIEEDLNQDMSEFACQYVDDVDELWQQVSQVVSTIENETLRNLVEYIYLTNEKEIKQSSSASNIHHVGIGGNLAHTLEVYQLATAIAQTIQAQGNPIDLSLVKAGALLHDIGKIKTYMLDGPVVSLTTEGQLLDHIVLGISILQGAQKELGDGYEQATLLLTHILAAHHGQLEYGSPVTPRFAEAYIVNTADGVSASLDVLFAANRKAEKDNKPMTDKLYILSNREHFLQSTIASLL